MMFMNKKRILLLSIILSGYMLFLVACEPEPVKPTSYNLTMEVQGHGHVTPPVGIHTYHEETIVTITAVPEEGWIFKEWIGEVANSKSASSTVVIDKDKTIQSLFVPGISTVNARNGTIEVMFNDSLLTEPESIDFMVRYRTSERLDSIDFPYLPVQPHPKDDFIERIVRGGPYEFLSITEVTWDGHHNVILSFEPFKEKEVETMYIIEVRYSGGDYVKADPFIVSPIAQEYSLTLEVMGEGRTEPQIGTHLYLEGSSVDLRATPSEDWNFKEWIGEVVDPLAIETRVMMDKDKSVTAVFEERENGWTPVEPGERTSYHIEDVEFFMCLAPASTFPTGIDDDGEATVNHDFQIAETQVTYELWYIVRIWAESQGYTFANMGMEGSITGGGIWPDYNNVGGLPTKAKKEPVTMVSWYDSVVWCNALSEFLGFDPVYHIAGEAIKSASGVEHTDVVAENSNGFRLPSSNEWELAARYKGSESSHGAIEYPPGSEIYWTPGSYASGATDDCTNEAATQEAAWYSSNSNVDGRGHKTQDVGQKPSYGNGLGLFDMSGNVWEWCFNKSGPGQISRGWSWHSNADSLQVGGIYIYNPSIAFYVRGLRIVRTNL